MTLNILLQNIQSQVTQSWVQRFNNTINGWDEPRDIAIDKLGDIYVTGYSFINLTERYYYTIKYNSTGVQQWAKSYNVGYGSAFAITLDDSANVYITGDNTNGIITIKYTTTGIEQWAAQYNGPDIDNAREIAVDKEGNVYVTGWSWNDSTYFDYITIKYNKLGHQQWAVLYNSITNSYDQARALTVDNSGNVYITGSSEGSGIITIKYSSAGNQIWLANYFGGIGYDIELDKYNNVYLAGYTGSAGNHNYITIKYDSSGNLQWAKTYDGSGGDDVSQWMSLDSTGSVYVTGYSYGGAATRNDFATIKYNSAGIQQWVARYNGPGSSHDFVRNVALDRAGDVYITGYAYVPAGGTFDFATVKYNGITGNQQWVVLYNGTGDSSDYGWALDVDSMNNVYVTGASFGNGTGRDFATVKYSQTIGIQQISNQIPTEYRLEQNYPNPFNPVTKIRFSIPSAEFVKLFIYDALGREISTVVNERLMPGIYETEWNSVNMGSGVYFYSLKTNGFSQTKKMMVIK